MRNHQSQLYPIAVLVPTYGRPHKVLKLSKSLEQSTRIPFNLYFVIEKKDASSLNVIKKHGLKYIFNSGGPTYASCINSAYHQTTEPILFLGADDLVFHNNWIEEALPLLKCNDVVGTNDLHNKYVIRGELATHFFIKRKYITEYSGCVDQPNTVLHDYDHYCVDTECVMTAKARKVFSPCLTSIVEHVHWENNNAQIDDTYVRAMRHYLTDYARYLWRMHLWCCIGYSNRFVRICRHIWIFFLNIARWLWFIPLYSKSILALETRKRLQHI